MRLDFYAELLSEGVEELEGGLGKDPNLEKFQEILNVLRSSSKDPEEREKEAEYVHRDLWKLYAQSKEIRDFIDGKIEEVNGRRGDPKSFDLLDGILSEQFFKLTHWKVANEEINYRRFFIINDLISVLMEKEEVFEHCHSTILELISCGKIDGVRVDHVDGLYDPAGYLDKLRRSAGDVYVVVEKVLAFDEMLPSWPVEGTTGYEFLNYLNGVFCCSDNEEEFDRLYSDFVNREEKFEDSLHEKKKLIAKGYMSGDIDNLVRFLWKIFRIDEQENDVSFDGLKSALEEVMSSFSAYRSYVSDKSFEKADRDRIEKALREARRRSPNLSHELDFIEKVLLFKSGDRLSEEEQKRRLHFIMRFQQFTGPLMAKGFEDTLLYTYNRLLSLNEVGGDPSEFGVNLGKFHKFNRERSKNWLNTMNTTSTHDTKRGEDVRARINILSEIPEEWEEKIRKWSEMNKVKKNHVEGKEVPDKNEEYFLYQTLIGSYPFDEEKVSEFIERIKDYVVKSSREAKINSSWMDPDEKYEEAFKSFVDRIIRNTKGNQFLEDFLAFQRKIAHYGVFNSISQVLIKITSPGVPDFYQGTELWDLNLVDPDNRRPVDYERRISFLKGLDQEVKKADSDLMELISDKENGKVKLFLLKKGLSLRREYPEVFRKGSYIPLETEGQHRANVIAFARNHEERWVIAVVPRFLTSLIGRKEVPLGGRVWKDTRVLIPGGTPSNWEETITGRLIRAKNFLSVGEALELFPVALLMGREEG